ncbi:dihydrofolate reductase [Zavarzinia compransoris]|uniref:dihydrofolate reductase n=1 Tax=Zavarzinia marina TaxID=2911065 RepID=UPI001F23624A|nr:dihydrofolate reductase [Zavarzinia marina]MCF4167746.1 dihydrofolate reductase [Zavarzinia marina]
MKNAVPAIAVTLVAARARNGVIGGDGGLPWSMPGDLAHFKALTMGHPLIMGRRTHLSIGRPLPGRPTIVLSRDSSFAADGVETVADLDTAIARGREIARDLGADAVMVIGGAEVFAVALPVADRLILSELDLDAVGDVHFPPFSTGDWRETARRHYPRGPGDDAAFDVVTHERRRA